MEEADVVFCPYNYLFDCKLLFPTSPDPVLSS